MVEILMFALRGVALSMNSNRWWWCLSKDSLICVASAYFAILDRDLPREIPPKPSGLDSPLIWDS